MMLNSIKNLFAKSLRGYQNNALFYYGGNALKFFGLRNLIVRLDTNWLCNLKCCMCHFSDPNCETIRPMNIDLFKKIAEDIFPKTYFLSMSCGAEPFMTKDFGDYLRIAARFKIPFIGLVTNGLLLNEQRINELIDNNVKEITISMEGATKETYEKIRVNGKFEKLLNNLTLLTEIKRKRNSNHPFLRFNYVVMKETIDELSKFVDLVSPFKPDKIQVRHIGFDEGMAMNFDEQSMRRYKLEFNRELSNFILKANKSRIAFDAPAHFSENGVKSRVQKKQFPACIHPWFFVYVHPNGIYRPCVYHDFNPVLNFQSLTYKEILNHDIMRGIQHNLLHDVGRSCLNICEKIKGTTYSVTSESLSLSRDNEIKQ